MEPEEEDVEIVPETSATAATDPRVAALHARAARELAADPLTAICFSAETARARGNACFGEGDVAGAVAEWTASVVLSGEHARCAESKALALANRSLARLHHWADARGAVMDAQAAVAAHPPYLKGHVRHAAALRCALGDGAKEVWHALAAADAQKLGKDDALDLKRHKALALKRRKAWEAAVAELSTTRVDGATFDERVAARLAPFPPPADLVLSSSAAMLPARCCARVGAYLDWRRAARPGDAAALARRALRWRGVCAAAFRTLDAGVLAPLLGDTSWAFFAAAPAKLVEERRGIEGDDSLLLAAGLTRCPRVSSLQVRGACAFPLDAALRVCGHRLTALDASGASAPHGFWLRALAGCPLLYNAGGALHSSSDEFCRALGKNCARLKTVNLEGATDLEAGAAALAKGCPELRDVSFARALRLSADALEPLFSLGRLERLALIACPNVGDALLEDVDELSEDRYLPLRRLELTGAGCTVAKAAEVRAALAERSTDVEIVLREEVPDLLTGST